MIVRRLLNAIDRLGAFIGVPVEFEALKVVGVALMSALATFLLIAQDNHRLSRFALEHVEFFGMADTAPQRIAFFVFFGVLVLGAAALRIFRPVPDLAKLHLGSPWLWRLIIIAAAFASTASIFSMLRTIPWRSPRSIASIILYVVYLLPVVWLFLNPRLPARTLKALVASILLLASLPAVSGIMLNVRSESLTMIDLHLATMFSGADLLASGYRLFADVPLNYGAAGQVLLGGALRFGADLSAADFIHVTEVFQVLCLVLFVVAAWMRVRAFDPGPRAAAILFVILMVTPFLTTASPSVLYANQSGLRFIVLPLAALGAVALGQLPLVRASVVIAVVATVALVTNTETGLAVIMGLGLGWLVRARHAPVVEILRAVCVGSAAVAGLVAFFIFVYFEALGAMPSSGSNNPIALMSHFSGGFGGLKLKLRLPAVFIFCHAGYLVAVGFAHIFGRSGPNPDPTSGALGGILIAWAPYWINRPDDWNLWSFLALYSVLVAPWIASTQLYAFRLAVVAGVLLVSAPLKALKSDLDHFMDAATMTVRSGCASGLSLAPDMCDAHAARAAELVRIAAHRDVIWITAYPFLTLRITGLRPPTAMINPFVAARTEEDVAIVANEIAAAKPVALVLDGTQMTVANSVIPNHVRLLNERIAGRAGFVKCSILELSHWQLWMPKNECRRDNEYFSNLRARLN